jgi:predicted DNA-binding protein
MRTIKRQTSNFNFRVEPRVKIALEDLANANSLTSAAYLRTLILREHANMVRSTY